MPQNTIVQDGISVSQQTDADLSAIVPDRSLNIEKMSLAAINQLLTFDAVVGTAQDVLNGIAQYTTLQSAVTAVSADGRILLLPGTYVENVTVSKRVYVHGQGYGSYVNGTITCDSSCDYSTFMNLRNSQFILQAGADGNVLMGCFSALAPTDAGTGNLKQLVVG